MTAQTTAREALIAEIAGDLAQLLDRADALQPAIVEATQSLVAANARLTTQLAAFEAQVVAIADQAKVQAVRHILARADEAARQTREAQTQAMAKAAYQLFNALIEPRMQRLATMIARLVERVDRPWIRLGAHAATALVSSATTMTLMAKLWPH